MASNNIYGNVSGQGLWDTVKSTVGGALSSVGGAIAPPIDNSGKPINPYEGFEPHNMARAQGNAILNVRDAITGEDSSKAGAIPAPDAPAQSTDSNVQSDQSPVNTDLASGRLFREANNPTDPNSQAGGAAAQTTQQEKLDASKQQVSNDILKGGNVPGPINEDPAKAMADRNQNIQAGVGNPITGTNTVDTPQALTDQQQKNANLQKAGDDTFKSMNTIGDWFQSPSFLMGMMQTGLSLLDGKGFAESFKTGSDYFDQHYGMEQRKSWADDLLNKGYDRQQIEEYVRTGDSKLLKSPAQLAFETQSNQQKLQSNDLALQGQRLQNNEAAYQQSDFMRQHKLEQDTLANQYKQGMLSQMQFNQQQKIAEAPLKQQRLELQNAVLQGKVSATQATQATQQAMAEQIKANGGNPATAQYASGVHFNDEEQIVRNPKTQRLEVTSSGLTQTVDTHGVIHWRNINEQPAETSLALNDIAMDHVRMLQGKDLGAMGGTLRSIGQQLGFRSEADAQQWVEQYNGSMEDAITNQLLVEANGKAVHKSTIEHAIGAAGKLSLDMSAADAQRVINQGARILNRNRVAAQSIVERNPEIASVENTKASYAQPGETQRFPDGTMRVSVGGPRGEWGTWQIMDQ